jgi:hypothetical protein
MSFKDSKIVTIPKADPVSKYGKTFQVANIYLTDSIYAREESVLPDSHTLLSTHHQNFQGSHLNLKWNLMEPRNGVIYDTKDIINNSYISGFDITIYENQDDAQRQNVVGNRTKIFQATGLTDNSYLYEISGDKSIRNYSVDVEVIDFNNNRSSGILTAKNPPPRFQITNETLNNGILTIDYRPFQDNAGNDISNNFQNIELYHLTGLTSGTSGTVSQESQYLNQAVRTVEGQNSSISIELFPSEINYLMPIPKDQFSTGYNDNLYLERYYEPKIENIEAQSISGGTYYSFSFERNYGPETKLVQTCYGLIGEGESSKSVSGYDEPIFLDSGLLDTDAYYGYNQNNKYIFDNTMPLQSGFHTGELNYRDNDYFTTYFGSGAGEYWGEGEPLYSLSSGDFEIQYHYAFYNSEKKIFQCDTTGRYLDGIYSMPKDNPNSYDIKYRSGDFFNKSMEEAASYLNAIGEMPAVIINPYQLKTIQSMETPNGWVGLRRNKVGILDGIFSERFLNNEIFLETNFQEEVTRTITTINADNKQESANISVNDVGNLWCWTNSDGSHIYKYAGSGYAPVGNIDFILDIKRL